MPSETEELRLRVVLDDQATAGLAALKNSVQSLSSGQTAQSFETFRRKQKEMGDQIKELSTAALGGERAMLGYIGKFGLFGFAVAASVEQLSKLSTELRATSRLAEGLGRSFADVQFAVRQLQATGVPLEKARETVAGLTDAVVELGRQGSATRNQFLDMLGPKNQRVGQQYIDMLANATTEMQRLKAASELADAAEKARLQWLQQHPRGLSPQAMAEDAAKYKRDLERGVLHVDPEVIARAKERGFREPTAAENKAAEAQDAAAKRVEDQTTNFATQLRRSGDAIIAYTDKTLRLLDNVDKRYNDWLQKQPPFDPNKLLNITPPGADQPLRFGGGGGDIKFGRGWDEMRPSASIEDFRASKSPLDQNTTQLSRLNDTLEKMLLGDDKGGALRFFGGGGDARGGPGGPGGGGLGAGGGLGGFHGGAPGGPGGGGTAPYGSSVGPGISPAQSPITPQHRRLGGGTAPLSESTFPQLRDGAAAGAVGGGGGGGGGGGTDYGGKLGTKLGGRGDPRGLEGYIRQTASKYGIDPDVAMRVAQSEGLNQFTSGIRGETSYGAFQLHTGGGLGDEFRKATGLDPADPKNEKATIDYALKKASQGGWGPWHGAAHVGIGRMQGIGVRNSQAIEQPAAAQTASHAHRRLSDLRGGSGVGGPVGVTDVGERHKAGTVMVGGETFHWGSGGPPGQAIPYGTYNVDPGGVGPLGRSGWGGRLPPAIAGVTTDASGNAIRGGGYSGAGIEIHSGSSNDLDRLYSQGCFAVAPADWPRFKQALLTEAQKSPGGKLRMTVQPGKYPEAARAYIGGAATLPEASGRQQESYAPGRLAADTQAAARTVIDRRTIDTSQTMTHKVDGTGTLTANITAPRGTDVKLDGGGIFKKTEINRQIPMEAARPGAGTASVGGAGTPL